MPSEEAWLVGEHRTGGDRKYYLSNLPVDAAIRDLVRSIKARWICGQAHQQLKGKAAERTSLGLDHFEGRPCIPSEITSCRHVAVIFRL